MNIPSYEVLAVHNLHKIIGEDASKLVVQTLESDILCIFSTRSQPYTYVCRLNLSELIQEVYFKDKIDVGTENNVPVDIVFQGSLPEKLSKDLQLVKKSAQSKLKDKPVTFHSKIKSSGYASSSPWKTKQKQVKSPKATKTPPHRVTEADQPPIYLVMSKSNGKVHNGPIMALSFSRDASKLATCSSDYSVRVLKLPLSKFEGEGVTLSGHKNSVTSVSWSRDQKYVISSSFDCSSIVWKMGCQDPIMHFVTMDSNHKSGDLPASKGSILVSKSVKASSKPENNNQTFKQAMRNAQFFFKDKFIVMGNGNSAYIYKYLINDNSKEDRVLNKYV